MSESRRALLVPAAVLLLTVSLLQGVRGVAGWSAFAPAVADALGGEADHLVISEVMTGGTGASDEFIEVYNPGSQPQSLAGLELVYITASGATITRKASWTVDNPTIPSGAHLLVANEAGTYATMANAVYANGLSATGGSVALRSIGASEAIDAIGWGTAASSWLEGTAAAAPAAGHSLERLPGGASGSGQDTDQNAADFVERTDPDPQNAASEPIVIGTPGPSASVSPSPTGTATPTATPIATATPTPTPVATATPMPTSSPSVLSIADARGLEDGTTVTLEGVSLTDGSFADGGGYLADAEAGIAILVSDGTFPRGVRLRVTGVLDDRYHQRTVRVLAAGVAVLHTAEEPDALSIETASFGEAEEGRLVRIQGVIAAAPSRLTTGLAFVLDDGSGPGRVIVHDATGIGTEGMVRGAELDLIGVVGQRDSTGTGSDGYRVQPRDELDILALAAPSPDPDASADPSTSASPAATPGPEAEVTPVAHARQAATGTRLRLRGVVTLPSALLHDGTAVLQDESGAIALRLGDEAGELAFGELVVVDGVRSTKSGMETVRVSTPPLRLGAAGQPAPTAGATGGLGESQEALLVAAHGAVATAPRRTSSQNVYFDLDDGSGPIRVFVAPATGIDTASIAAGDVLAITGVLGQETTGQQPLRGYRIWVRSDDDIVLVSTNGTSTNGATKTDDLSGPGSAETTGGGPAEDAAHAELPPLPAPRLAAARISGASLTPGPALRKLRGAASAGATVPADADAARGLQLALVAVVVLGAAGSIAARRPGIGARLREAMGRLAAARSADAPRDEGAVGQPVGAELAAARLVPLTLVEDEPVEATGSRSARTRPRSRRILPPT